MKYLIKSIKWTKNDGIETWWKANSSGYTWYIYNAGVYTEEDKEKMKCYIGKDSAFIPISEKLIEKGKKQIEELINERRKDIDRYKKYVDYDLEKIKEYKEHFKEIDLLENIVKNNK